MRRLTFALVLLMTVTLPLESAYSVPGGDSLSTTFGLLAAGSWLLSVVVAGGFREPGPAHLAALLFVLWNGCSLFWTIDASATQVRALTYVQLVGLMLVLWDTVTTKALLMRVLLADLVGSYVAAVSLVVGYAEHGAADVVHGRVTIGSFNPNDAGLILALAMPIAAYFIDNPPLSGRGRVPARWAASSYFPLAGFAILGTGSRAAVAAGIASLCYVGYLLARRSTAYAVAGLAGVVATVAAVSPFVPSGALIRLVTTGRDLQQGDLNERQQVWPEALRLIHEHPVLGVGSGSFRTGAVAVNKVGHNFVLALLAEIGVVGLALFCAVLALAFVASRRAPSGLPALWVTVSAAWMAASLLHNWEYRKLTWVLLALMVASGSLHPPREEPAEQTWYVDRVPLTTPEAPVGRLLQLDEAT